MIKRDIENQLKMSDGSMIQVLVGPRQCGKSTVLAYVSDKDTTEISLDDLQQRQLANNDPALFLDQHRTPLLLDEVQYAPQLLPELKRIVDKIKREQLQKNKKLDVEVIFKLTGSNQVLMDKHIKESLAGRASFYYLNTLSVNEIKKYDSAVSIADILFKGGWPELYVNDKLQTTRYLNDYIRSYIEKDIVLSAGIQKQNEFFMLLSLLASRTACFMEYAGFAKDSGVKSATIKEWVSLLERNDLVYHLPTYSNHLNKRLIKSPKFYFLDTGLAVCLQGWSEAKPMLNSPQAGPLFETLVLAEMVKFIRNYRKNWRLYTWRTKDKEEVDFLLEISPGCVLAFDAKLAMQSVRPMTIPPSLKKQFPDLKEMRLVTYGGVSSILTTECRSLPIAELHDYLLTL